MAENTAETTLTFEQDAVVKHIPAGTIIVLLNGASLTADTVGDGARIEQRWEDYSTPSDIFILESVGSEVRISVYGRVCVGREESFSNLGPTGFVGGTVGDYTFISTNGDVRAGDLGSNVFIITAGDIVVDCVGEHTKISTVGGFVSHGRQDNTAAVYSRANQYYKTGNDGLPDVTTARNPTIVERFDWPSQPVQTYTPIVEYPPGNPNTPHTESRPWRDVGSIMAVTSAVAGVLYYMSQGVPQQILGAIGNAAIQYLHTANEGFAAFPRMMGVGALVLLGLTAVTGTVAWIHISDRGDNSQSPSR